jgi:hypothetical protein
MEIEIAAAAGSSDPSVILEKTPTTDPIDGENRQT